MWARLGQLGLWVLLTYVGVVFAGDIHLTAYGPTFPFDARAISTGAAMVGFVFGAVSGAIIGSLQWIVLRSWAPRARGWIGWTALGFGLAHMANDALDYRPLDLPWMLLLEGLVIGACQAIALRHAIPRAWLWAPLAAIAWFGGMRLAVELVLGISQNPLAERLVGYGAASLVIGLVTGVALVWQTRSDPLASAQPALQSTPT